MFESSETAVLFSQDSPFLPLSGSTSSWPDSSVVMRGWDERDPFFLTQPVLEQDDDFRELELRKLIIDRYASDVKANKGLDGLTPDPVLEKAVWAEFVRPRHKWETGLCETENCWIFDRLILRISEANQAESNFGTVYDSFLNGMSWDEVDLFEGLMKELRKCVDMKRGVVITSIQV